VGGSHPLPAVERGNKKYAIISLVARIRVATVIVLSKG